MRKYRTFFEEVLIPAILVAGIYFAAVIGHFFDTI